MYPKRTPPDACNTPKTDMKTRTYAARNGYKLKESCHIPPPQDKTKNILEQTQERHRLRKSSFQSSQKRQPFQQNCALHKWKYRPFMTLYLKKIDDHRRGKWASCLRYMGSMGAICFSITIRMYAIPSPSGLRFMLVAKFFGTQIHPFYLRPLSRPFTNKWTGQTTEGTTPPCSFKLLAVVIKDNVSNSIIQQGRHFSKLPGTRDIPWE